MSNKTDNNASTAPQPRTRTRAHHIQSEMMQVEKPRIRLSRDINKAMTEVMATIINFKKFLLEETKALKDADTPLFLQMQDEKLEIARDYLEGMSQLMARKEDLKKADEKTKLKLEDMRNDFANIAADNYASINRMKNGMKRLSDRIMEAARETARRDKEIIYGATGRMMSATNGTIGINESA